VDICQIDMNLELSVSCVAVKCRERATMTRYQEMDSQRKYVLHCTSKGMVLVMF